MNLVIEMICQPCSQNNCTNHISSKKVLDKKTGLEIEVKCFCKNCENFEK